MPSGAVDVLGVSAGMVYALNQPRFAFRLWPEGCVAHDEADGSLYELTVAAGEVLSVLQRQPSSVAPDQLAHELLGDDLQPGDLDLVQHLLVQLCELGIVRSASA